MNNPFILIRKFIVVVFFSIYFSACSTVSSFPDTTPSETMTLTSDITERTQEPSMTPIVLSTAIVTATPFDLQPRTEDEIKKTIEKLYSVDPNCRSDLLQSVAPYASDHAPEVEFIESNVIPDESIYWIDEIADNYSRTLRAFVACDPAFCQPKIYVQNLANGMVQEINWSSRLPWRPIMRIMWVGDNLLTFFHPPNPQNAQIGAINI